MFIQFVRQIRSGDQVVMPDTHRGEIILGEVSGPYKYHEELAPARYRHRRKVDWLARHSIADLPESERAIYRQRPTVVERPRPALRNHCARVRSGHLGRPARDRPASLHGRRGGARPTTRGGERVCLVRQLLKPDGQFVDDACIDCR